jgi:hypothetical protein
MHGEPEHVGLGASVEGFQHATCRRSNLLLFEGKSMTPRSHDDDPSSVTSRRHSRAR